MNLKLNALKINVTKIFIIAIFVFSATLKNEDRLLSKINKIFTRLFFIKDFFLYEIITTTIQFTNLMKGAFYMLILHRQLNNFLFNSIKKRNNYCDVYMMFIYRKCLLRAFGDVSNKKLRGRLPNGRFRQGFCKKEYSQLRAVKLIRLFSHFILSLPLAIIRLDYLDIGRILPKSAKAPKSRFPGWGV